MSKQNRNLTGYTSKEGQMLKKWLILSLHTLSRASNMMMLFPLIT